MCGICGYWGLDISEDDGIALLQTMSDQLVHRGPDDAGFFVGDNVGLAMRRLKVIDLQGGNQPMSNERGTIQLVFNGEIYNYQSLRQKLVAHGHSFSSVSDTEVIVHQYETNGVECLQQFNGMFAFALWDEKTKSLFIARDRLGVKPLYYFWDGQIFLFASEIKALLAIGRIDRHINWQSVWHYLSFRYVPGPDSIWKHIFKLPPAHFLQLNTFAKTPTPRRYWDIPYSNERPTSSIATAVGEFETLFLDAVQKRLIADVPVGVFLSGGLDSSAITAAIAEVHDHRLASFSVGFEGAADMDERPYAREVAKVLGTDHHEITIHQQDFLNFLPDMVYTTDEPLADLTAIPLYYLSRQARAQVTVVLSGEGSDEILGGYDFEEKYRMLQWLRYYHILPTPLRAVIHSIGTLFSRSESEQIFDYGMMSPNELIERRWGHITRLMNSEKKHCLLPDIIGCQDSIQSAAQQIERCGSSDPFHRMLFSYCQSWLVEDLLMKADKMSMANSLELRVPFLDYRLVEWAARQSPEIKINRNRAGNLVSKWALRQFAEKRLPKSIIDRPKAGFPLPAYHWLAHDLKTWAFDLLQGPDAMLPRWFNRDGLSGMLKLGTSETNPSLHQHRLWNLLILELWMRRWQPTE